MTLVQFVLIQINLAVLFGLYKWLAARKGQFTFNRWYLLLAPLLAIGFPYLALENTSSETLSVMLPAVTFLQETEASHVTAFHWSQLTLILGSSIVLILFYISLRRLLRKKKGHYLERYKGAEVYLLDELDGTTHSLFNRIFLNPAHAAYREIVLEHEYAHCKSRHSWDLILMAFYKALFWFNPFIYGWEKEMKLNHEYLADAHVLAHGTPPKTYGTTLLALNFSHSGASLVHAFNQPSSLRKRIVHFNHQNKFNMKHLLLIPAVAALAFATTSMVASTQPPSKVITTLSSENHEDDEVTNAEYPGGKDGLMNYLMQNLNYPKNLEQSGAEGKVFVKFTISKNGTVKNVSPLKSSGYEAMDNEAVRVIKNMQAWTPATKNGANIATEMTLPILFKLAK